MLELEHIQKAFDGVPVLKDLSLQVEDGEIVSILGPSGCGKTTLLNIILGIVDADQGEIRYSGEDLTRTPMEKRGFNIVFQDYALFPNLNVQQNITYGLRNKPGISSREEVDELIDLLGLPYPGGPGLSRLAEQGDPKAFAFPRPLLHSHDLDFSFAGLKTAVLTQVKRLLSAQLSGPLAAHAADALSDQQRADVAASTQAAIVEVLVKKSLAALTQTGLKRLVVAGGVGANKLLRAELNQACAKRRIRVHYPELHLCTDNGAMIAMAAAMRVQAGLWLPATATIQHSFGVRPRWPLDAIDRPA